MVVALVLVVFALVGWVIAGRVVGLCAALGRRAEGARLVLERPPVPASSAPEGVGAPGGSAVPAGGALECTVVLMPPAPVPRPVRRCGNCRAAGHTRPACPRLTGALPLPHL